MPPHKTHILDILVGVLVSPQVYYIHTDYLNIPRIKFDLYIKCYTTSITR